jgi:hypothetical protein
VVAVALLLGRAGRRGGRSDARSFSDSSFALSISFSTSLLSVDGTTFFFRSARTSTCFRCAASTTSSAAVFLSSLTFGCERTASTAVVSFFTAVAYSVSAALAFSGRAATDSASSASR